MAFWGSPRWKHAAPSPSHACHCPCKSPGRQRAASVPALLSRDPSIAQLESTWMLQTPPNLTRVPEGLQGMQVALGSSPVVPELAAGVCQVPKALPLSSPVPQSTWNWEHRVPCQAVAHAAKPRGGGSSVSYRAARPLAGASAAPCQSCAGRCGQRPNSAAEQPPAAGPGPAPHRTARGPAQSSRQPGRRCGAGSSRGLCRCRVSLG